MEDAGFLMPGAPLPTDMIVEHMAVFYDTVRERGPRTVTGSYATAVTRRFFKYFQDASVASTGAHFGSLCSAHRIMWRLRCPIPRARAFSRARSSSSILGSSGCTC